MEIKFKVLNEYVLIRPDKEETVTKSGILTPTKEDDRKDKGVVVNAQEGSAVKAGDHVAFRQWPREEIELDGEKFFLTKFENIIGIYE